MSSLRIRLDVQFDDPYLRFVGPQERAKTFQHDLVIVDERDTNRLEMHHHRPNRKQRKRRHRRRSKTRSREAT
jgi:hypothetical protein